VVSVKPWQHSFNPIKTGFIITHPLHPTTAELSTLQSGSRRRWWLPGVYFPLHWFRCSEGWGTRLTGPLLLDAGPCSWRPRRPGQGWTAAASSGVWSPGRPGRGAPEGGEGAALSGLEAEVEACPCEWPPSAVEVGGTMMVLSTGSR